MNKRQYIHTMDYYLPTQGTELFIHMQQPPSTSQILRWEASLKRLHCMIPFIQRPQKDKIVRMEDTWGVGWDGVGWGGCECRVRARDGILGWWKCSTSWLRWQLHKSILCVKIHRAVYPQKLILLCNNLKNKINATFTLKRKFTDDVFYYISTGLFKSKVGSSHVNCKVLRTISY